MANKVKILGKEYDEQEVANQLGAYDKLHGAYTKGQQELANLNDLKSFRDQLEAHPKLRAKIDAVTQEYVGDAAGGGDEDPLPLPNKDKGKDSSGDEWKRRVEAIEARQAMEEFETQFSTLLKEFPRANRDIVLARLAMDESLDMKDVVKSSHTDSVSYTEKLLTDNGVDKKVIEKFVADSNRGIVVSAPGGSGKPDAAPPPPISGRAEGGSGGASSPDNSSGRPAPTTNSQGKQIARPMGYDYKDPDDIDEGILAKATDMSAIPSPS